MSTTSIVTNQTTDADEIRVADGQERRLAAVPETVDRSGSGVPDADVDHLEIRIAGPAEGQSIADLATRAGSSRPAGALMVGALDGRLVAAVSMSNGQGISEPTPSGAAAAAVVRYMLADSRRRRRTPHLTRAAA